MQPNEQEQVIPYRHGVLSTTANVAAGSAGGAVKGGLWGGLAGAAAGTLGILAVPLIAVGAIAFAALVGTMIGTAIYAAFSYSLTAGIGMLALSVVGAATAAGSAIFGPVGAAIGSVIGFFKGGADSFSRTQQETGAAQMVDAQVEAMRAQAMAMQAQAQLQGARFAGQSAPVSVNPAAPRINVGADNAEHQGVVADMARNVANDNPVKTEDGTPVMGAATEKLAADRELREQAVQSV